MTFKLAVVAPHTDFGQDARERNLGEAQEQVARAAAAGAKLVSLPESFPGEWRAPVTWTPEADLAGMAREHAVYLVGGFTEPLDEDGSRCYNTLALYDPDGAEVGRYRRTTPSHAPWVYKGGPRWDFDWVAAAELPVFETELGKIGLAMCSEIYAPEIARILAVKGAEVILMPAGLIGPHQALFDTWRTLTWARAIENLAYTAISANITDGHQGLAMICSPEEVVLEECGVGVHVAEVDLERVRWLRDQEDRRMPATTPWRTKPGNLRDWRRQEVFDANPEMSKGGDLGTR